MLLGSKRLPQIRQARNLLYDDFASALAAGSVNGTPADPGPGLRSVTDSNSKLSLAGGTATFATGGVGNGNPGLYYTTLARLAGRALLGHLNVTGSTLALGFDADSSGQINDGVRLQSSSTLLTLRTNLVALTVGVFVGSTDYQIAVIARAAGCFYFIKGGAFVYWTLLWISTAGAGDLIPAAAVESSTATGTVAYIRVPSALWLPAPGVSDGFSAWGTSDGLGHAEGVAGGLGSGGAGVRWTDAAGTWAAAGGVAAASALSGGVAVAVVDAGVADVIATVEVTHVGGTAGLVARYADANNYVTARHTGTNVQLAKVIASVATTLIDTAVTYVAGAELRLVCEGQAFRVFYDGAAIGAEQTIADTGVATATQHGLRTSNTGNTFDDFVLRARGSGGEYARLDNL